MSKAYIDEPEQFKEWLRERGLTDPVTGEMTKPPFDSKKLTEVIKLLVISFNDFEARMSLIRPAVEELANYIQCPECSDSKDLTDETCHWCKEPE